MQEEYQPDDFEDESRFEDSADEDYSNYVEENELRPSDFEDEIPEIYASEDESRFENYEDKDCSCYTEYYASEDLEDEIPDSESTFTDVEEDSSERYRREEVVDDINELVDDSKNDGYNGIETSLNNTDINENILTPCLPVTINEPNTTSKISAIDTLSDAKQNNAYDKLYAKGQNLYDSKMVTYSANEQANNDIAFNEKRKYTTLATQGQYLLIEKINNNGLIRLWKYKDDFYFRFAKNSECYKGNKNSIADIIRNFFGLNVRIVSQQDITQNSTIKHNQIEDYIFTHQIPLIDKEVFEPSEKEFFKKDGILYKNKFVPTKFLEKRFCNIASRDFYDCFIINFLENLVNETDQDDSSKPKTIAILKWLSRCFITMNNTHVALVLNGSKYLEDIFWEKLIKPIFGNEQYCVIINDEMLKKSLSEIVEEKVFFKIEDFTPTKENKQKIEELLNAVLVDKYLLTKTYPQKKIHVFGQVFITANETLSYMKNYHTHFEYINILDENKIISNLAESRIDFKIKFNDEKEIDVFIDCLAVFDKNNNGILKVISQFIQQDEEEALEKKIDAFIEAIKKKNKLYFKKIGEDNLYIYKELEFAFEKGCFVGQDLSKYFNLVYGKEFFESNSNILSVLKEKDPIFLQELTTIKTLNEDNQEEILFEGIRTYKEVGNKKLYRINNYTLPEDIVVPRGRIIINREGKQRFKYNYEDIDLAKKAYIEYDKANADSKCVP